jgi:hypothetical protein
MKLESKMVLKEGSIFLILILNFASKANLLLIMLFVPKII